MVTADVFQDVLADLQLVRSDEEQANARVPAEQIDQRADRAAAEQVADERHGLARKRVLLEAADEILAPPAGEGAVQRVDVQQRLGGVLVLARAAVDDR